MLRGLLQTLLIISGFIAFGLAAAWIFAASPCQSGWCPSYKCYGTSSCGNCLCMSRGVGGVCVDLQQSQELIDEGWAVLP